MRGHKINPNPERMVGMDGTTIDRLNEALAEVGGIDGFIAVMGGIEEKVDRETDELWALTEGGLDGESLTDAESLIIWDDDLTHQQKVRKLRALRATRRAQMAGTSKVIPIRLS